MLYEKITVNFFLLKFNSKLNALMKYFIKKLKTFFYKELHIILYNVRLNKSSKINGFSKFNGKEIIGNNVNFNGCKIYGNGIVIFGNNFHSGRGLVILTSYHNYKGMKIPYDESIITKNVVIEDNVWIGLNVTILGGVTIGEGAIIQAGSVVVKDVCKLSICGGNPAQKFSQRDGPHYYLLKNEGSFF